MDPDPIQTAVRSARAGQPEGYRALLEVLGPRLMGYFYRATGDRHEAEDLLGELMLRLVRTLPKYDERGRFEPWLFRIAANLVRDRLRRRRSAGPRLSLSVGGEDGEPLADEICDGGPDVADTLVAREEGQALRAALETLDEPTRQTLLLRHFGQMSFAEIAQTMGCPLGTALARAHRGLRALRSRLAGHEPTG